MLEAIHGVKRLTKSCQSAAQGSHWSDLVWTQEDSTGLHQGILPGEPACASLPSLDRRSRQQAEQIAAARSKQLCGLYMMREAYQRACHCTPALYMVQGREAGSTDVTCTPRDLLNCAKDPLGEFESITSMDIPPCKAFCFNVDYSAVVESVPVKREYYSSEDVSAQYEQLNQSTPTSLSIISIYFPSMTTEKTTRSKTNLWLWLGAFGGQTGLCTGASVITIFEVFVLLVYIFGFVCVEVCEMLRNLFRKGRRVHQRSEGVEILQTKAHRGGKHQLGVQFAGQTRSLPSSPNRVSVIKVQAVY